MRAWASEFGGEEGGREGVQRLEVMHGSEEGGAGSGVEFNRGRDGFALWGEEEARGLRRLG